MLYQPETKSMWRDLSSLPERSEGHILHTKQFSDADQSNNMQKNVFFKAKKWISMQFRASPVLDINLLSSVDQFNCKIGTF